MAKLIAGSASVFAFLLLCPVVSHAGNRTYSFEVTDEPVSVQLPTAASVDCESLADCTFISSDPTQGNHNPAIQFIVGKAQVVHVEAGIWATLGCSGDPDGLAVGDINFETPGLKTVRILFNPPIEDGTPLALRWIIGSCAVTACADFASLGCEPPPYCNPP